MTAARRRDEILQALAGASGPVSAAEAWVNSEGKYR